MVLTKYMTTIVPRSLWIVPVAVLTLFGAGCLPSSEPISVPTPIAPTAPAANNAQSAPTPTPSPTATPSSNFQLPTIDDSWKTYTNKAETFSFQWPTKGKYAPTWSVKIISEKDPAYKDGCYYSFYSPDQPNRKPPVKLTVNGTEFCHAPLGDGFAGGFGFMDTYTAKVGNQVISIVFEKIAHGAGACMDTNPVCKQAFDQQAMVLSYASGAYAIFIEDEYLAHLDQIVGTFTIK